MGKETVKRFSVDRSEGEFLVLIADGDCEELVLRASDYPDLKPNDVCDVARRGSDVLSVTVLPDEREKRQKEYASRLNALFRRNQN